MKISRLKLAFKDALGSIRDILDNVPLNSIAILSSKKGVVRGNHYHKKTVQWLYLLQGRVRYVARPVKGGPRRQAIMKPGDLAVSPPGEAHTVVALEDSEFLAISRGPRHGVNYEADTYRLEAPLVKSPKTSRAA